MPNKRQRKKNYNKWADKMVCQIWNRRPKDFKTQEEADRWLDEQVENEGILSWRTQQAVNEAIYDAKSPHSTLKTYDSVDELMADLESDD
ncbi:MAG TPA: hypothetical protein DDW71_04245 [Lactobacillus sp.]|nr:hypothetical protein [Lactobacillus sp.]